MTTATIGRDDIRAETPPNDRHGREAARAAWKQLGRLLFILSHNSFALVGLAVLVGLALIAAQPEWRLQSARQLTNWLQKTEYTTAGEDTQDDAAASPAGESGANVSALAADPKELTGEQARLAYWISRKYHVAPEPISLLVKESYQVGKQEKIDPTLILAIMAIESSFNPYAQSHVGAQGLMQVMTRIHSDKYEDFGGNLAAFDPASNLRVGVKVLKETIAKSGSLRGGLKYYSGAANMPTDMGYGDKVLAEQARLEAVVRGKSVAPDANLPPTQTAQNNTPAAPAEKIRPRQPPAASVRLASARLRTPDQAAASFTSTAPRQESAPAPKAQTIALARITEAQPAAASVQ